MTINIYVCAVIAFATLCLGHIIGYKVRKKDEEVKPITMLVKEESIEDVAKVLHENVVVILNGEGKMASLHLGEFHPTSELIKKKVSRD